MYKSSDKQREWQRHYQRKRRLANKEAAVAILGGECERCGYRESIHALQIDHIVPILRKHNRGWSEQCGQAMARAVVNGTADLSKLQLLCANCHCIKTSEDKKAYTNYVA